MKTKGVTKEMDFSNMSKNKKIAIALTGIFIFSIVAVPLAMGANPDLTALLKDIEAKLWSNSDSVKNDTSIINAKLNAMDSKLNDINNTMNHIYFFGTIKQPPLWPEPFPIWVGGPAKITLTFEWQDDNIPGADIEIAIAGHGGNIILVNYTVIGNGDPDSKNLSTIEFVIGSNFNSFGIGPMHGGSFDWDYVAYSAEYSNSIA
jgi:hypothetical protein